MTKILTSEIWDRLTALAKKSKKSHVAVAYINSGSRRLLPLKRGSVLVVDLSARAVKSGSTNPSEVLKFVNAGVEVHTQENLHAKVFVFPRRVVIGSSNVSKNSQKNLIEAALESTDTDAVKAARGFVLSLTGDRIGPDYCKEMAKHYRPPKGPAGKTSCPTKSPIWVVPLTDWKSNDTETEQANIGRAVATKRLKSNLFTLDEFLSDDIRFKNLSQGNRVLQIFEAGRDLLIKCPGKVLYKKSFMNTDGKDACVFLELPSNKRGRRLSKQKTKLGSELTSRLRKASNANKPICVRAAADIQRLEQLWL
jgi:hypothetical protein